MRLKRRRIFTMALNSQTCDTLLPSAILQHSLAKPVNFLSRPPHKVPSLSVLA
jgi:hypothetical protein